MDAKEAIKRLKNYEKTLFTASGKLALSIELEMAIEALEKLPVLEAENASLKESSDKWTDLMNKAGAVGLTEADFFKMVETVKEVMLGPEDGISCKGVFKG